jgi:nucleotide-binding universal stress UspA family protein
MSSMPGIVVGIDGSEHSRRALDWAVREAAVRQAPLTVLTVQQPVTVYWGMGAAVPFPDPYDQDLVKQTRASAEKETASALEQAAPGFKPPLVEVRAVAGLPAEELLRFAADADLVVVGSRGAGGFARLLMGSVSTQVTQHAHCPVVVIPSGPN